MLRRGSRLLFADGLQADPELPQRPLALLDAAVRLPHSSDLVNLDGPGVHQHVAHRLADLRRGDLAPHLALDEPRDEHHERESLLLVVVLLAERVPVLAVLEVLEVRFYRPPLTFPKVDGVFEWSQLPHRGATSGETMAGSACYQAIIVDRQGAGGRMGNRDPRCAVRPLGFWRALGREAVCVEAED